MPLLRPLHPGQLVARYELLQSLAEGALATTWLARRAEPNAPQVVLKTLPIASLDDPDMEDTFFEETERAREVKHKGVAQLLEAGRDAGSLYVAYECVPGHTLAALLRAAPARGGVPRGVALRLMLELSEALGAVHAALQQPHRAANPGNLMITPDGTIKLLDLGVSAMLTKSSSSTTFRHMVGKFSYLSPEQLWSRPVDVRSDVFTLGLLGYELLVGQHPFRGRHDRETTTNTLSPALAPSPSQFGVSLPPALEAWLLRSLAKAPGERFADAEAMHRALLEALSDTAVGSAAELAELVRDWLGEPSAAQPAAAPAPRLRSVPPPAFSAPTEPLPVERESRLSPWLLVALLVAAVGAGVWLWIRRG